MLWYHSVIRQISVAWAQLLSSVKVRVLKWNDVSFSDGHKSLLSAITTGGHRDVSLLLSVVSTLNPPTTPV